MFSEVHAVVAVLEHMKLDRYARALARRHVKHAVLRRHDVVVVGGEDEGRRAGRCYVIFGGEQSDLRGIRHWTKQVLPRIRMSEIEASC